MLGLPHTTELSKQLPKKAIFAKFGLNNAQQERFNADVSRIVITNEVSEETVAIVGGERVKSFYVVSVHLKQQQYSSANIVMLSKLIPQRILFVLLWEDKAQLAVYETELICSDWGAVSEVSVELQGLDLDSVWDNIILSVGGITIEGERTISEQIKANARKSKLQKQIEQLERKARAEKQPRRKLELVEEINRLKQEI